MNEGPRRSTALVIGRFGFSALLLLTLGLVLDVRDVASRLADLSAPWVLLGLGLSVLQVVALAWRWRFTASRLGLALPMRTALGEYYSGILVNQLVPGGVPGDAWRAWRQARSTESAGRAIRAVILERASGQLVMTAVAVVSFATLSVIPGLVRFSVTATALAAGALLVRTLLGSPPSSALGRLRSDTRRALLHRGAFLPQLASGVVVVASYIAVFLIAARAVGVTTPFGTLLPLVAPVLMTMLIPVSIAGWGVREGTAAGLWAQAGLTPEEGVAVSVAYGLLVLASSLPGLPLLTRALTEGRDRRERPGRGGSAGTEVVERHPE